MGDRELINRLERDRPKLHFVSEDLSREIEAATGQKIEPGLASWAVPRPVLQFFETRVEPAHRTLETGGGYSTVALAALAAHHTCITPDLRSIELIQQYLAQIGLADDRITFIAEPSEIALPRFNPTDKIDFAFVDGNHCYPYPAIDWHFIDLNLKTGGILGFDNCEIPSVHNHCEFMESNGSYHLVHVIENAFPGTNYLVKFYEKLKDEPRWDILQRYNHRRVTKSSARAQLKRLIKQTIGLEQKSWPWS